MKSAFLTALAAVFLAVIVGVAWLTVGRPGAPGPTTHVVAPGESAADIATMYGVDPAALATANGADGATFAPKPGDTVVVPAPVAGWRDTVSVHAVGLLAQFFGVLLSFWLGLIAGLVPHGFRRQIFVISAILGTASYAAVMAVAATPQMSPQFVFSAVQSGFAWAAGFPLFARAFGFRGNPPPVAVVEEAPPA